MGEQKVGKAGREFFGTVLGASVGLVYLIAHVVVILSLFHHLKLWAFLVAMFVPGVGDVMGIYGLISTKCWWPFIAYGIAVIWYILVGFISQRMEKHENSGTASSH